MTTTPGEAESLVACLGSQRRHVLGILDGLPDDALRRAVLPSGWTCLGLVRHLALDVERFWFRAVVAGEQVPLEEGAAAWHVPDDMPAGDVLALYRDESERSDSIARTTPLDAMPKWWPSDAFGGEPPMNLRDTLLHVIVETACHAGHLDVVRELTDGRSWMVLT